MRQHVGSLECLWVKIQGIFVSFGFSRLTDTVTVLEILRNGTFANTLSLHTGNG